MNGPNRICKPGAIAARLCAGRPKPVTGVVLRIAPVAQPTDLVKLMPCRTTNRSISSRPERPVDEFRKRIPALRRTISEMFSDQFPSIIVGRVDLRIGTVEEWDVLLVPNPIAIVPETLPIEQGLFVQYCANPCLIENTQRQCQVKEPPRFDPEDSQRRGDSTCQERDHRTGLLVADASDACNFKHATDSNSPMAKRVGYQLVVPPLRLK